jgi:two-component system, chemotaxis family, protein-glutamate methylesterase/glutaminase
MKRVLVVDDSCFMRKSLTHILRSDRAIEVVDTAVDGEEAIRKVKELRPDVVVLDVEMSVMSGLEALARIMTERPTPVLMLTGVGDRDGSVASACWKLGAVDFIPKPSGVISYDIQRLGAEIIAKVKRATARDARHRVVRVPVLPPGCPEPGPQKIVVIGASTGGPAALAAILPGLPPGLPAAVLVVQHMAPEFVAPFADRLRTKCPLAITVARQDEPLTPGRVVVAPGGCHTLVVRIGTEFRVQFSKREFPQTIFPSVDCAMETAAMAYGERTVGVLLTGMGNDGARGLQAVRDAGGKTIAQDPSTCLIGGMPKSALDLGCVGSVAPLHSMARTISEMV